MHDPIKHSLRETQPTLIESRETIGGPALFANDYVSVSFVRMNGASFGLVAFGTSVLWLKYLSQVQDIGN